MDTFVAFEMHKRYTQRHISNTTRSNVQHTGLTFRFQTVPTELPIADVSLIDVWLQLPQPTSAFVHLPMNPHFSPDISSQDALLYGRCTLDISTSHFS